MVTRTDSPSFVFLADPHFHEKGAWKYRGITGDDRYSFTQAVDFCCETGAGVLAIGGDILDNPNPRPETIKFLRDQFTRLQESGVAVVYILGQHDARQDWPSIHSWPIHLHGQIFDVDEFTICGFDYMRPAEFMENYPKLKPHAGKFLLCHQVIQEFMGNVREAELALARMPFAMDDLLGDFHALRVHNYCALDGSAGTAYSPGSTHVRDVAEEPEKWFFAFYRESGSRYSYETIKFDTRPVQRYQLTSPDSAEKFLAKLDELPLDGEGIKRAVIDVAYHNDIEGLGAELARLLEGRCHLFLRQRSRRQDERTPSVIARRAVADRGLVGAVDLVCEPGPVRDSSVRLLEAADPRIELEAMKAEFFTET